MTAGTLSMRVCASCRRRFVSPEPNAALCQSCAAEHRKREDERQSSETEELQRQEPTR